MNICSKHGDEIVYASIECPACEHLEEVTKELKSEYNAELTDLEGDNDVLYSELKEYKDKYGEL